MGSRILTTVSLCWFLATSTTFAFDANQADAKLAKMMIGIAKNQLGGDPDKLQSQNDELLKYLKSVVTTSEMMASPLKQARAQGMAVFTSSDDKLRCYSWDTLTGGTMHNFDSLMAYKSSDGHIKFNSESGEGGSMFEGLDTVTTSDGKTVYLVRDLSVASSIIHGRRIQAYIISNGKLEKYPFFKTPKKIFDRIDYSFTEYSDQTDMHLSDDKKTLRIPVIKEETTGYGGGKTTGKFLTYRFDGKHFVFTPGH